MAQSRTRRRPPASLPDLLPHVRFDAGRLTSDGGLAWIAQADAALGLCAALADQIPDWRRGPVRHSLETLVRQRVFQITCGYEDQDDADTLRHDPLLKWVCGRPPASGADLASQPTLSRLENAVDARTCYRLAVALLGIYLQERARLSPTGRPAHLLLDLDGTADPTHGEQEGSAYHGYYRQRPGHAGVQAGEPRLPLLAKPRSSVWPSAANWSSTRKAPKSSGWVPRSRTTWRSASTVSSTTPSMGSGAWPAA